MFLTKPTGEMFMLTLAENFQTRAATLPKTTPPPPPPQPPAAEANSVLVLPPPWSLASYLGAGVKGGRSLPQGIPSLTHTHGNNSGDTEEINTRQIWASSPPASVWFSGEGGTWRRDPRRAPEPQPGRTLQHRRSCPACPANERTKAGLPAPPQPG